MLYDEINLRFEFLDTKLQQHVLLTYMYVVCFITWVLLYHLGKLVKRAQGKICSQVQQDWNPSRQQKVLHVHV